MIPLGVLASARVAAAAGGGGLTFLGTYAIDTNSTGFTIPGVSIGPPASNRTIIVAAYNERAAVTGVTIGGVSATVDVVHTPGGSNNAGLAFAHAVVPTGTTASVDVTAPGVSLHHAVAVWSIPGTLTLVDSDSIQYSTGGDCTLTLTTVVGGLALAVACGNRGGTTATWAGITEDFDFTAMGVETGHFSGGSADTTGDDITITPTFVTRYAPTHVAVTYTIGA